MEAAGCSHLAASLKPEHRTLMQHLVYAVALRLGADTQAQFAVVVPTEASALLIVDMPVQGRAVLGQQSCAQSCPSTRKGRSLQTLSQAEKPQP